MAVTLTYDTVLSRVRVAADNLGADATYATVERTTDGTRWTTVRGATAAIVDGEELPVPVDDYEFPANVAVTYRVTSYDAGDTEETQDTAVITANITTPWLKSITRPFLNRAVQLVGDPGDVSRPARNGIFEVVGRSYPVAVTDVRGSKRQDIAVLVRGSEAADEFDLVISSGDPIFLHVPPGTPQLSTGNYAVIGDTTQAWVGRDTDDVYVFTLPLTQTAAPAADIVGTTVTCQTILNDFATCQDVLTEFATCADLLQYVASPSDVIVS